MFNHINEFCEATTIHGFAYVSRGQLRSTRIIWTVLVLAALGIAAYFLYETVDGFEDNYTRTKVEARSIQDFPYPAVTFHPGEYNSEDSFLRNFLNEFEFIRYYKHSDLKENSEFLNLYSWLISPMNEKLFNSIIEYLLEIDVVYYSSNE